MKWDKIYFTWIQREFRVCEVFAYPGLYPWTQASQDLVLQRFRQATRFFQLSYLSFILFGFDFIVHPRRNAFEFSTVNRTKF
jgi:hypothetical protein